MDEGTLLKVKTTGGETIFLNDQLPLLPVRDSVVFPGMTIPLAVGRPASLAALDAAGPEGLILVATQRDPETENPNLSELHRWGCISRVIRIVDTRAGGRQAVIIGLLRAELLEISSLKSYLDVRLNIIKEPRVDDALATEKRTKVLNLAHRVIDLRQDYPNEWKKGLTDLPNSATLSDLIASNLPLSTEERIAFVSEESPAKRLEKLMRHLEREIKIVETQNALKTQADRLENNYSEKECAIFKTK